MSMAPLVSSLFKSKNVKIEVEVKVEVEVEVKDRMFGAIIIFGIIFLLIILSYMHYNTIATYTPLVWMWKYIVLAIAFLSLFFPTIYRYYMEDQYDGEKTLLEVMQEKHGRK